MYCSLHHTICICSIYIYMYIYIYIPCVTMIDQIYHLWQMTLDHMGISISGGTPIAGIYWKIMENPTNIDDFRVPPWLRNLHIYDLIAVGITIINHPFSWEWCPYQLSKVMGDGANDIIDIVIPTLNLTLCKQFMTLWAITFMALLTLGMVPIKLQCKQPKTKKNHFEAALKARLLARCEKHLQSPCSRVPGLSRPLRTLEKATPRISAGKKNVPKCWENCGKPTKNGENMERV